VTAAAEAAVWDELAAQDLEARVATEVRKAVELLKCGDCADTQAPPAEEPTE
jgi:hypothetical protein